MLLYISSAPGSSGPNCQAPHNKISIVEVPLDAPENASVIAQPAIEGQLYGSVRGCHDITVFPAINKAAAACQSEGQLWDITNPAAPVTTGATVRHLDDPTVNYWHSSAFTWDGQYVVYMDESFTGRCTSQSSDGKIRIYRVATGHS